MKGGLAVCQGDKCESLQLEVAGIMSDVPCGTMASSYKQLSDMVTDMGSNLMSPFMTLSFMALLVIPELKLSDRGLFDGRKFEFTDLFI
jgi:adenine deaminase